MDAHAALPVDDLTEGEASDELARLALAIFEHAARHWEVDDPTIIPAEFEVAPDLKGLLVAVTA